LVSTLPDWSGGTPLTSTVISVLVTLREMERAAGPLLG